MQLTAEQSLALRALLVASVQNHRPDLMSLNNGMWDVLPQLAMVPTETLAPVLDEHQRATYGFVPGVATTSLAAQTAARLGVTREELIALVRRKKR